MHFCPAVWIEAHDFASVIVKSLGQQPGSPMKTSRFTISSGSPPRSTSSVSPRLGGSGDANSTGLVRTVTLGGTGGRDDDDSVDDDDAIDDDDSVDDDGSVELMIGGAEDVDSPDAGGGACDEDDDSTDDVVELLLELADEPELPLVSLEDPVEPRPGGLRRFVELDWPTTVVTRASTVLPPRPPQQMRVHQRPALLRARGRDVAWRRPHRGV